MWCVFVCGGVLPMGVLPRGMLPAGGAPYGALLPTGGALYEGAPHRVCSLPGCAPYQGELPIEWLLPTRGVPYTVPSNFQTPAVCPSIQTQF